MKSPIVKKSFLIGNRGEAFLEFIMSKHCLMHKTLGHRDVGIDYICEWLVGKTPSRILFGIQVKTTESKCIKIEKAGVDSRRSELEKVSIKSLSLKIDLKKYYVLERIRNSFIFVCHSKGS